MSLIKDIASWLGPFSSFQMRQLERHFVVAVGLVFLALWVLIFSHDFERKVIVFALFMVGAFFIPEISKKIFGKLNPSPEEEEIIRDIQRADKSNEEKRVEIQKMLAPAPYTQTVGVVILTWWLLVGLFLVLGLAKFLNQFEAVRTIADIVPKEIFLEKGLKRTDAVIELLQIYKVFQVITYPIVTLGVYWALFPIINNTRYFPMLFSRVYWDRSLTKRQKIKRSIFYFIGFFCFVAVGIGGVYIYGIDGFTMLAEDSPYLRLDVHLWYKMSLCSGLLVFHLVCAAKIIDDAVGLISHFIKRRSIRKRWRR